MKYVLLLGLFLIPMIGSYTKGVKAKTIVYTTREVSATLDNLTVYNPVKSQCDRTPLITASNARIDLNKLKEKQIRWIALSRNLLKRWKGAFQYGDTIKINAGDPDIDGYWVIQDNQNKRYKNCGDLLFDRSVRRLGKWKNVTITKEEKVSYELMPS